MRTTRRNPWPGRLARGYGVGCAVVLSLSLVAQIGAERDWLGRGVALALLVGLALLIGAPARARW